jgi:hypothetical protein
VLYLRSLEVVSLVVIAMSLLLVPGLPALVPFGLALGPAAAAFAVRRQLVGAVARAAA